MNLKKLAAFAVTACVALGSLTTAFAATAAQVNKAASSTAAYLLATVKNPSVGSIGGEWSILGLARSGENVPEDYYSSYYAQVESCVKANKGVLHDKKYTEYSRVILALTAIGKNPESVAGYNLLEPLGDFDKTVWQGINGPIFALIALDSGGYDVPVNKSAKTQATRELYIKEILSRQLSDGGFALSGTTSDPDITAMALQALAKYQSIKAVKDATDKALTCLSNMQNPSGGYSSWGVPTSESSAQVLTALCELGISPYDSRFVKAGRTVLDDLLSYHTKDGAFKHTSGESGETGMSTEQCFYALAAYQRFSERATSLYRMTP